MLIRNSRPSCRPPLPELKWSEEIPSGWLPVDIGGSDPVIRWMNVGTAGLSEPFFHVSVNRLRAASAEIETELSVLERGTGHLPPVAPSGIIFNMSRCGSTLLVSALREAENVVVLSEAMPIENTMYWTGSRSTHWARRASALLTPLTTVFSHYQGLPARNLVIKCSVGAIAALREVRKEWPNVPCIVPIRDPIEVLASNLQLPPQWLQSAYNNNRADEVFSGLFGAPPANVMASGITDLCAWVIGRYCAESLSALDDKCRVVDYEDLTPETAMGIAEFFGLSFSPEGLGRLQKSFRVNAKKPGQPFSSDGEAKRSAATEGVRKAARRWVSDSYQELRRRAYRPWRKGA